MKTSKRIFKSTITLFAMSAMLFSWSLWPPVQDAVSASPKGQSATALRLPRISISITIGRAKKACGGFGICKISIGKASAAARTVDGEISATDDGKLQLRLLQKAPEEGRILFVDQDIPLSQEIARKLGFKSAAIQQGEYTFSASRSVLSARLTK